MSSYGVLELRRRGFEQMEGYRFWLLFGAFVSPLGVLVVALVFPFKHPLLSTVAEALIQKSDASTALQVVAPIIMLLFTRVIFRAKLILDNTGIRYHSGIPERFQLIRLDWQCRWSALGSATWRRSTNSPLLSPIIFSINNKPVRVVPWQWVDPTNPKKTDKIWHHLSFSQKRLYERVQATPLMRFLDKRGILVQDNSSDDPAAVLNANRTAQVVAGLFITSVVYFVVDFYFGSTEYFVPSTPWHVFIVLGAIGMFIAYKRKRSTNHTW